MAVDLPTHRPTRTSGPTPSMREAMGQPVGPGIELGIGEGLCRRSRERWPPGVRSACISIQRWTHRSFAGDRRVVSWAGRGSLSLAIGPTPYLVALFIGRKLHGRQFVQEGVKLVVVRPIEHCREVVDRRGVPSHEHLRPLFLGEHA